MNLIQVLPPQLCLFLTQSSRDQALDFLCHRVAAHINLCNATQFYEKTVAREQVITTGIGMGVALPHAKLDSFPHFVCALGVSTQGIPWNALDGQDVKIVFLIGGPQNAQKNYLQLLSQLTKALKNLSLRQNLIQAQTPQELFDLITTTSP